MFTVILVDDIMVFAFFIKYKNFTNEFYSSTISGIFDTTFMTIQLE